MKCGVQGCDDIAMHTIGTSTSNGDTVFQTDVCEHHANLVKVGKFGDLSMACKIASPSEPGLKCEHCGEITKKQYGYSKWYCGDCFISLNVSPTPATRYNKE